MLKPPEEAFSTTVERQVVFYLIYLHVMTELVILLSVCVCVCVCVVHPNGSTESCMSITGTIPVSIRGK